MLRDRKGASEDGCMVIVAILACLFTFSAIYYDITVKEPERKRLAKEAALKAQIEAEARAVPVANKAAPTPETQPKRFSAEFHGEFFGGFQNHVRQIFILTDNQTGYKYLAVTGCGVSELRLEEYQVKEGKNTVTKTKTEEE